MARSRPMHAHNVKVTLTGPFDSLGEINRKRILDGVTSAMVSFGFPRESQRRLVTTNTVAADWQAEISLSDPAADAMEADQFFRIEKGIIDAVHRYTGVEPETGKQFQRHPAPLPAEQYV
jgi:hypothetical protein